MRHAIIRRCCCGGCMAAQRNAAAAQRTARRLQRIASAIWSRPISGRQSDAEFGSRLKRR